MKKSMMLLALLLGLAAAFVTAYAQNARGPFRLETINVNGLQREYYIYNPRNNAGGARLPLVMFLHGGGKADGDEVAERLKMEALAEREQFLLVYPNGIGSQWNDGRGMTFGKSGDPLVDDVRFISELIDHLVRTYRADPRRVYVSGASNGGMMTLRLANELPHKIRAAAAIIANIPVNIVDSSRTGAAVPMLIMNGTDDPMVPYEGGQVTVLGKKYGAIVSTAETVNTWVRRNGCNNAPRVEQLPNKDRRDRSTVEVHHYSGGRRGSEVILYKINGGGHTIPGTGKGRRYPLVGVQNMDIYAPEVLWQFFERHR